MARRLLDAAVIPLPHQLHVLRRVITSDHMRFLLADEVGLGKTIEAGLIMRELKLRGLVRRTLVLAPRGLVTQWIAEMDVHFNEEFRHYSPSDFPAYRQISREDNVWRSFDQIICSLDSVKPVDTRKGWSDERLAAYNRDRFVDLVSAGWDLVICDEAHRLGGSTDLVARHKLGQGLAEAAPYVLLLSATPHQGKTDAFHRIMKLLDHAAFPDADSVTKERVYPYVIRTEKRNAIDADGKQLFTPRNTHLVSIGEYHASPRQQTEWTRRCSDYVNARQILDGMLTTTFAGPAQFLAEYEKLVGAKDRGHLWHSDFLYRAKVAVAAKYTVFLQMLTDVKTNIGGSPSDVLAVGKTYTDEIGGLSFNVLTEIMNTYGPDQYAVLNNNPVESLKEIGMQKFPSPGTFKPATYAEFVALLKKIQQFLGLSNLSHVDHFLNYVYWKYVKNSAYD